MTVPGPKNLNSESEISPDKKTVQASPVVRFASENEEIEPQQSLDTTTTSVPHIEGAEDSKVKELTQSLQGAQLAGRRMSCFAFEPVSLPASRVCPFLYLSVNPNYTQHGGWKPGELQEIIGKLGNSFQVAADVWIRRLDVLIHRSGRING